jgi:hypothetical protein
MTWEWILFSTFIIVSPLNGTVDKNLQRQYAHLPRAHFFLLIICYGFLVPIGVYLFRLA